MSDAPQIALTTHGAGSGPATSPKQRRVSYLPGDGAMWFFVLGDMIILGLYFVAFMIFRAREVGAYTTGQQNLYLDMGVVNTVLLLFSSWVAARSVLAARRGDAGRTKRLLGGTAACGAVFIVLKLIECWLELSADHTFPSGAFMSFYYVLTGVHMLHVVMGLSILAVVIVYTRSKADPRPHVVEQATTFWRMVDLLWVVIFALLYVMR